MKRSLAGMLVSLFAVAIASACRTESPSGAGSRIDRPDGSSQIRSAPTHSEPPVDQPKDAGPQRSIGPAWDTGTIHDRLMALAVTDSTFARRDLFSWTTAHQVAELRERRRLLVATSNDGAKSPFVWLVESLARRTDETGALAKLLATDERFSRRRYAWSCAYPTVLGLAEKRYGDELLHVRLGRDAVVVRLDPTQNPPFVARDFDGHEVPVAALLAAPARIGAIFHVRSGVDVPAPFREVVLVNEDQIERYGAGTPPVHAEVRAEARLLRDLLASPDVPSSLHPARPARMRARVFVGVPSPGAALGERWDRTLAFPIPRYELDAHRLHETLAALEAFHSDLPALESELGDSFGDE
jgi:hypothetical protein